MDNVGCEEVERVYLLLFEASKVVRDLYKALPPDQQWQADHLAAWIAEIQLSFREVTTKVGFVGKEPGHGGEYFEVMSRVVGVVHGDAKRLQYLARWDQTLALAEEMVGMVAP